MIVNIRGYSGSGKSTAVKNIIKLYAGQQVLTYRKHRPLVTRLFDAPELNECIVIGPYDNKNQTNGCDTIAYNEQIKLLVEYFDNLGYDVLLEGMMLSTNHTLITELAQTRNVCVLYLDIPIDQIIQQRKQRAIEQNRNSDFKHEVSVMNTKTVENSLQKIIEVIPDNVYRVSHDDVVLQYVRCICNQDIRTIKTEDDDSKFELYTRYDTMISHKNKKKTLPPEFFEHE